ncbi:MAG: NOL1/NOP2/sun family putative RNA methylase [Firmicutes bacterium]|nr:NOL1/NOP2/sun family putative RNA methylase [Candidatus Fiminaster equi]
MTFEEHLKKYLDENEIKSLVSSFNEKEKKAIFLNTNKMSEKTLLDLFPTLKPHPVVPNGFIFDKDEIQLGKKVYHEQGAYYIQEPSAMLVAHLLNANKNDIVLDLCAAPGGKTIQTALKMENEGLIIANDLSKSRANVLLSNIERLGIKNTVVTSLDFSTVKNQFQNYFDKIILDAPCSGSGMFRKSDEMKSDWTYEKVLKNSAIQKDLILMCYSMLKEGGTMVYSTCSYSYEEDEEIIGFLLEKTTAKLQYIEKINGEFRSKKYPETIHLFPSKFDGEGHYIAIIKKPGNLTKNSFEKIETKRTIKGKGNLNEIQKFSLNYSLPEKFINLSLRPGLFLSSKIGEKEVPSHHISHASNIDKSIPLNQEGVIKYLRGESINKKYPDGYYFVSYLDMNLGVVHSVNGTLKNLYPKGLRINADIKTSF